MTAMDTSYAPVGVASVASDAPVAARAELPLPTVLGIDPSQAAEFRAAGDAIVEELLELCRLRADSAVLDVASADGRVATGLWRNGHAGAYLGLEVARPYIHWCSTNITPATGGRMEFHHLNLVSPYNPDGTIPVERLELPLHDASVDVGVALSTFTHMAPAAVERYLRELVRVVKPGGRILTNFFVADETWEAGVMTGRGTALPYELSPGVHAQQPGGGTGVVGYSPGWLHAVAGALGLRVHAVRLGQWGGRDGVGDDFQDVVVFAR
jgi:SAM-dependent methyltransferase